MINHPNLGFFPGVCSSLVDTSSRVCLTYGPTVWLECPSPYRLLYQGPGVSGLRLVMCKLYCLRGASTIFVWGKGTSSVDPASTETLEALHPPLPLAWPLVQTDHGPLAATFAPRWIRPLS